MSLNCLPVSVFSNAFCISFLAPILSDANDEAVPGMWLMLKGKMLTQQMFNMCLGEETSSNRWQEAKRCLLVLISDRE